jgi:hypothetical protein
LPDLSTWYLATNLPHPGTDRALEEGAPLAAADLWEVVRLYGLRMWVEQSYKQVKHALGWSQYQVRSDLAMRRHWQLVCCAFSFCWWASSSSSSSSDLLEAVDGPPAGVAVAANQNDEADATTTKTEQRGEKGGPGGREGTTVVATSVEGGEGVAGAVGNGVALLAGVLGSSPTTGVRRVA